MGEHKLDITDRYIRARQVEPDMFLPNSFKTIRLAPGVKAIIGRKKGETKTSIQSVLFDKKRFTPEKAKVWLDRNSSNFSSAVDLEEQKTSLFAMDLEDHMEGHLPPLTEKQIERLLELAGPADSAEDEEDSEHTPMGVFSSKFVKRV